MTAHDLLAGDFGLIADLVAAHAAEHPDKPVFIEGERIMTYGAFDALADRVAASLQRDEVGPGSVVAICAGNSIEWIAIFFGALRAGAAVAPLAPSASPDQLADMIGDADARLLFLDGKSADHLRPVASRIASRWILIDDAPVREQGFTGWLTEPGSRPAPVTIRPEWPFNYIYSSGTTGTPKGIVQSHAFRWMPIARGALFAYGPSSVTVVATLLYSNYTLVPIFMTLAQGGSLVLMRKFDALEFLRLAEHHRTTHVTLVPVQYRRLLAMPEFDRYDLTATQMKFVGSAPSSHQMKAELLQRWPGGLIEIYAMTEGGGNFLLLAHEYPDKLHTVGQPAPGNDVRIVDEDGREMAQGELGEIVGRSTGMMMGYHNQPDKSASAEWFSAEGDRFIKTGDIGRYDEDGFLILTDRKKDMIISGGFNIYPSDIEEVVQRHPSVQEVAVVGVTSDQWGETPVAFVALKSGQSLSAGDLAAFTAEQLGATQRPQAYQFVASLPRSAVGKVLKRELRDAFRGQVA
ncbi:MAG: 4-coumarate--CoA ligase [Sphingomonadales bacterium]|nr:MAG: 4-coumarate--CoA ligase [Sphingomonadales bacterium]